MKTRRKMVKRWIAGVLAVTMLSSTMSTAAFAAPESTDAPETMETARVTAWNWTDGSALTWQEDTSAWTLTLSEEQTISAEADLLALLPVSVEVTLAQAEAEATPAPDTAATPAPESTPDTEATEVTPTPVAEVDPAAEEGATAPAAAALAQPEEGAAGADTLSVEPQNNEEATPAPETATPAPTAAPQPAESPAPTADAEPTEEPAATETLTLTWDTAALTYPLAGGDYTVTAALPEGYALDEGAPALAVVVKVSGAEDEDTPAADNSLGDGASAPSMMADAGTVQTVTPVGTTINLFDYWVNSWNEDDSEFEGATWALTCLRANDQGNGINKDHILKFFYEGQGSHLKEFNKYTGSEKPWLGIVQNKLVDGYPKLNDLDPEAAGTGLFTVFGPDFRENINNDEKKNESLAYLFDPNAKYDGTCRASYTNVKGLLKVTEDGYYSYDSDTNYAYFDRNQTGVEKSFVVYDTNHYGFFPFNTQDQVYPDPDNKNGDIIANHYFGLTMTTRFVQQNMGISTKDGKTPITYEFTGDDDVWVFIDGVLVGDLGGVHNAASLKIDFSTGKIVINNDESSSTTLYDAYVAAGSDSTTKWRDKTFADNTYHTLQLFYLERGNNTSNLRLKFNMESTTASTINNVDQDGYGKSGLTFNLYATDRDYIVSGDTPVYTGTTETDGVLNMTDQDGNNVKLSDLHDMGQYFVLREANPPEGYRSLEDVHLKFMNDTMDILLVDNPTESGAYATPMVTTTLPRLVYKDGDDTASGIDTQDPTVLQGTFFAVVLKRNTSTGNNQDDWLPVYGDAMNGWQLGADSSWESILQAAKANPYIFAADNTGLRVTIENLPGDLSKYYYILQQNQDPDAEANAQYTVAYYYTTASSIDEAIDSNTVRLDTNRTGTEEITREFSAHIYVPNVKNYVVVQSVGPDGQTPINGVTYSLYAESKVAEGNLVAGATADDTVITTHMEQENGDPITADGVAVFPSTNKTLTNGTYYLKETAGPEGYQLSDKLVKVIVNDTGVYADAGAADDAVTVLRGAGKIVRSMLQFAVPDAVSTTLTDITATLKEPTGGNEPMESTTWETVSGQPSELNLSYHASDVPLEYGLSTGKGDPYFVVDEGWSRVEVTQNYNGGSLVDSSFNVPNVGPKEDWRGKDLTDLFSRSTVVRIKNETQLCDLTINKIIESPVGNDSNREFEIQLTLKNEDNTPVTGSINVEVTGTAANNTTIQSPLTLDENGTVYVPIKLDQDVTFKDVPYGTKFTVTESALEDYTTVYSVTVTGDATVDSTNGSGTLTGDGVVTILNERKAGSVAISNAVEGAMGSYSDTFSYTLKLYDKTADNVNPAISGTYQATLTSQDGTPQTVQITFTDGQATQMTPVAAEGGATPQAQDIKLAHGDTLTISGLPAGATVEATENEADTNGYTTTVAVKEVSTNMATVPNSADVSPTPIIAFTNTREAIVPTGMREENNPYIVMIGLAGMAALVGAAGWVEMRRRKRREEE